MARKNRKNPVAPPSPRSRLWVLLFLHLGLSPVVFSSTTTEPFDYPKSLLLQFVGLVALGAMVLEAHGRSSPAPTSARPGVAGDPLAGGVLLFGLSAVLSTLFSISPRTSLAGAPDSFAGLPVLLAGVILFFATRRACSSWSDAWALLYAAVIGASVAASYALVQAFGFDVFGWERVAEFGGARPFGTLGNANTLSAFLAGAFPIEVCLALLAQERGRPRQAAVLALAASLGAIAIVRSASRAGWLGLGIGVVGVFVIFRASGAHRRAWRFARMVATTAAALLLVALSVPSGRPVVLTLWERLSGATGVASRGFLWRVALDLFREYPFLGAGVDTFGLAFPPRRTPEFWNLEWNTTFVRAHNEILQLLATQGGVGAIAALLMGWGVFRSAREGWRLLGGEDRLALGGVLVALLSMLPQVLLGVVGIAPAVFLIMLAALVSVAGRGPSGGGTTSPASALRWSRVVAGLAPVLLFLNAGVWQGGAASTCATLAAFAGPLLALLMARDLPPPAGAGGTGEPGPGPPRVLPSSWHASLVWSGSAIVALTLLFPAVAADAASARARRLFASDPSRSMISYERATRLAPDDASHWSRLGQAAAALAHAPGPGGPSLRRQAVDAFSRAVATEPLQGQFQFLLCRAVSDQAMAGEGLASAAFEACDEALKKEPSNPYFHTAAVNGAVRLGDLRRARRLAEAGLRLYPRFGPIEYQLGFIALQEGRLEESVRWLTASAEDDWHGADDGRGSALTALEEARRRANQPTPGLTPR